jgi:RNA polymerase sigma-70 factor, ECF subfamily
MASVSELEHAYTRYGSALVRKAERMLGSREDALDSVHELFVRFVDRRPRSLELPYLYVAVTRACLNRMRDEKSRRRLREAYPLPFRPEAPYDLEGWTVSAQFLERLIHRLDPKEADVLWLCLADGLSQEEAAGALGVSRRTVVNRLKRAREIAGAMSKEGERS